MKAIISIFKVRFALTLQYRMTAIAAFFTQLFFGFVMVMIYDAFFNSTANTLPMTFSQTVTYIWLGQAFFHLLPWIGDREVQAMIRNGDFVYEMLRPMDVYCYWYFKILSQRIAGTLLRSIPLFLMTILIIPEPYKLSAPASLTAFFYFLITMTGAVLLGGTVANFITVTTLITIGTGLERMLMALVSILSGMVIPLSFFPEQIQLLLKIQPFSSLVDAPYRFYLGIYNFIDFIFILVHQIVWSCIFILAGKWIIHKAGKRIIVQGG